MKNSPFTAAERVESLKVAVFGGAVAGVISVAVLVGRGWVTNAGLPAPSQLFTSLAGLSLLVMGAIAVLSGALFALTYRYAVRQDDNPQLNAGVVLAFTLVRGLAQVDAGSAIAQRFWPFFAASAESLAIFGSTAIALNIAFARGWVTPFGQSTP